MRTLTLLLCLCLSTTFLLAQSKVEKLVGKGVALHDKGDYDGAIDLYKQALKLDPNSELVNYELALSYFHKKAYKTSIKYSDKVINSKDSKFAIHACVTKGSCLDVLGKTKESIKFFNKAIKKYGGHYLLYYNLAVNYYRTYDFKKAEEIFIKGIKSNPNHASSHLMLAYVKHDQGERVPCVLALHHFLFLEPVGKRAEKAYALLKKCISSGVTKGDDNTININVSSDTEKEFSAAELTLSMLEATRNVEENKDKTEEVLFIDNTSSFFAILGELDKGKKKSIWWKFYIPFFYDIVQNDHIETYCYYISQGSNEKAVEWLKENEDKIQAFDDWLRND